MLKRLRRQFVLIVMVLVGAVMAAVLGSSFISARQTQSDLIARSLERGMSHGTDPWMGFDSRSTPTSNVWKELLEDWDDLATDDDLDDDDAVENLGELFGDLVPRRDEGDDAEGRGGLLCLVIDLDQSGTIVDVNDAPVTIDGETLVSVIGKVLAGTAAEGHDTTTHVAWKSCAISSGTRVAIVDTTSPDLAIREQGIRDIQIICVALVALFGISWWLSSWALRPVERAWEQQRRFVADASHELKTPLAVILANTQILLSHEGVSTDAMRWVESTNEEAGHMKALVGDLLQLARSDETVAGEATGAFHKEPVDLSEMVEAAALEFDAVAFERGCMIQEDVTEGVTVSGDAEWLTRLVRILIDNACKYAEKDSTVDVVLREEAGHAHLTVHNVGNPIDAEDLPHVFERFYRSDKAREREAEGGFGLGLAIAKGIVDAHGGKISASSSEAEGTTFAVTL